jgi:hypothetical protein
MSQAVAPPPRVSDAQTAQTAATDDAAAPAPAPPPAYAAASRAWASPDPFSPFRWYTVADFGSFYEQDTADTRLNVLSGNGVARSKASATPAIRAAEATRLGRVYLDWSSVPLLEQSEPDAAGNVTVTFSDLRFAEGIPFLQQNGSPTLTGNVVVDARGRVLDEIFDGRQARGYSR